MLPASASAAATTVPPAGAIAFLMVPDYTIVTLTSAIAVLRMANRESGRELYRWRCLTIDGQPVLSSDGLRLLPDGSLDALQVPPRILFVCGGYHPERHCEPALTAHLVRLATAGAALGALCTGSRILAEAGLLDGYRCAIHWENAASLREQFPTVQVSSRLFVVDRDRYTCSGGTSSIDLMLRVVTADHGVALAQEIAEQFVLERMRTEEDAQRLPLHHLVGAGQKPKLVEAVALMEGNLEEPLRLSELGERLAVSRRQLERLFHHYLGCTPSHYYLDLRLRRGRALLLQTGLPVAAVARRCGFESASAFGRQYAHRFGRPPRDERRPQVARPADGMKVQG